MKVDDDDITMECSGRVFYANLGIIGIGNNGNTYDGYDGGLAPRQKLPQDGDKPPTADDVMTPEERRELALAMSKRWLEWGGFTVHQNV